MTHSPWLFKLLFGAVTERVYSTSWPLTTRLKGPPPLLHSTIDMASRMFEAGCIWTEEPKKFVQFQSGWEHKMTPWAGLGSVSLINRLINWSDSVFWLVVESQGLNHIHTEATLQSPPHWNKHTHIRSHTDRKQFLHHHPHVVTKTNGLWQEAASCLLFELLNVFL